MSPLRQLFVGHVLEAVFSEERVSRAGHGDRKDKVFGAVDDKHRQLFALFWHSPGTEHAGDGGNSGKEFRTTESERVAKGITICQTRGKETPGVDRILVE